MKSNGWYICVCLLVLGFSSGAAEAADRDLSFLRVLQENAYGDVAVDYLKILDKRPDLPPETRAVWDLEMSRSLRSAASTAFNAAEAEELTTASQTHLAKFLKEKPNHPQAMSAMADWATISKNNALQLLRSAEMATEADKKAQFLKEARTAFEDAKPRFKDVQVKFRERLAKLPPAPRPTTGPRRSLTARERDAIAERAEVQDNILVARFELALTDYYLAQTCDEKDAARKEYLTAASKAFDTIFQEDRLGKIGLFAHMWQGKCVEELGDTELALDIYDEVLANAESGKEVGVDPFAPLFAKVMQFRLGILAKKQPAQYYVEAEQWLKEYKAKSRATEGYQGIAYDLAKAAAAEAAKATGADKDKWLKGALALVRDNVRVSGPYQRQFSELLRKLGGDKAKSPEGGSGADGMSFEECVGFGDLASTNHQWEEAERHYTKALAFADDLKNKPKKDRIDETKVETARNALAAAVFMQARDRYTKNKLNDCIDLTRRVIMDFPDSPAASAAGALAVQTKLYIYATMDASKEEEKKAALDSLIKVADYTIKTWPGKPEADDARIALGQACLARNELGKAIDYFEKCNARSERYGVAMQMSGQTYWRLYILERKKAADEQDADKIKEYRENAAKRLGESVDLQRKSLEAGKPMPKSLIDTQLLAAEIAIDADDSTKAIGYLEPLVALVKGIKTGDPIDPTTLRVAVSIVRAYLMMNELNKASEVGMILAEGGPDDQSVNGVLVEFAKQLNASRKQAEGDLIEAGADAQKADAAKAKLAAIKESLKKLMPKLAERKQISVNGMVLIADVLGYADLNDLARAQYEKILEQCKKDPVFKQKAEKAITRVRVQLVGLLKKSGQYDKALTEARLLETENPKALEPKLEIGRILQRQAETAVKDAKKWSDAISQWKKVRDALQSMKGSKTAKPTEAGKPIEATKPPEFFEVTYDLARCYTGYALGLTDQKDRLENLRMAEKILTSTKYQYPKLNGPDMIAQYNALLATLARAQGRKPGVLVDAASPADGKKPTDGTKPDTKPADSKKPVDAKKADTTKPAGNKAAPPAKKP